MERNKISIWFYIFMAIVALGNTVFQLINGTYYWGNGAVFLVFLFVIVYKSVRLYKKENLIFWKEDTMDEQEDSDISDEDADE